MKRVKIPLGDKEYVVVERREILKPLFDVRVNLVTLKAHVEVLSQMIDSLNINDESKSALRDTLEHLRSHAEEAYDEADKLDDKFR